MVIMARSSRRSSTAGSSARKRRRAAPEPLVTAGPTAMPGARTVASNWRGRVAPRASSDTSCSPAAARASASSMATVSTTSTSSVP